VSFQVQRSNRATGGVGNFEATEHGRHITNLIRMATIKEVDLTKIRAKVMFGNEQVADSSFLSGWLPLIQPNTSVCRGGVSEWQPPKIGDIVPVFCIGGEMENGQILPSANFMTPQESPFGTIANGYEFGPLEDIRDDVWRKIFADGTLIEFDLGKNLVRVETPGSAKIYAGGQIILKSPFVQVDCDAMHVKGKLLCSDTIVGMTDDLSGNKSLDLLGDPINLNDGGGVAGIAAGLIGQVASLPSISDAVNTFGNADSLFTNVTAAAGPLSDISSLTGVSGSLVNAIPQDILGAAMNVTGVDKYLGPLSEAMSFIEDPVDGFNTTNMLNFAVSVANSAGLSVPSQNGFDFLQSNLTAGNLNINQLMDQASTSGIISGDIANQASLVRSVISDVQTTENLDEYDPADLITGLRSNLSNISDDNLIETIAAQNFEPSWELLLRGDTNTGSMISQVVNNGERNVEQLLDVATQLNRGDHSTGQSQNTAQSDPRLQDQIDYAPAQTTSSISLNCPTTSG